MNNHNTTAIDAEDLQLYIDCDRDLYKQIWTPVTTMLTRRKANGTYDHNKAAVAFKHLIDTGAKKCVAEFPEYRVSSATKAETIVSMRDRFEIEYDLGNYEYLLNEGV